MKLIVTELILLILSNVLQIVSLAAPGWFIRVQTYLWKRDGIFYTESCSRNDEDEKWDCEKKSWLDVYHDDLENVRLNKTFFYSGHNVDVAYADRDYHYKVRQEVLMILVLTTTLVCLVIQIWRSRRKGVCRASLGILASSGLATASGLMISQLSAYYIENKFYQVRDDIAPEIRFPYCVLLYTIALLVNLVIFVIYVIECSKQQNDPMDPMNETHDIVMTEPKHNVANRSEPAGQTNYGIRYQEWVATGHKK